VEEVRRDAPEVIIFGLGRFGSAIGLRLKNQGVNVLGVDFNPFAVRRWRELGLNTVYGDATDPEFVSSLPFDSARWVLSTVPDYATGVSREDPRLTIIQTVRSLPIGARVAVTSHDPLHTSRLLANGADIVLEPFDDAADRAAEILCGSSTRVFPRPVLDAHQPL
jgi:Trk K+ transport system NAD-binding subunit